MSCFLTEKIDSKTIFKDDAITFCENCAVVMNRFHLFKSRVKSRTKDIMTKTIDN